MRDNTREVSMLMQQGVRASKVWSWWIFYATAAETRTLRSWTFQILLGSSAVMFAFTSAQE